MKRHFVTFLSPGTLFDETRELPISGWDPEQAKEMAKGIVERYNATPYGFYFTTRERKQKDLDSREVARSSTYHLGGRILTAEEILAGTDPKEDILRSNVECNDIKRIIVNENSWRHTCEFHDGDVLLDWP